MTMLMRNRIRNHSVPTRSRIVLLCLIAFAPISLNRSATVAAASPPPVLKDDRTPDAITSKDLMLYARWLALSPAQENMVALSFVSYQEQLAPLRSKIAAFQSERFGEPIPREALVILRKRRGKQDSLRAEMTAADSAFLAQCEAVLSKPQLPAMEMVRNHRLRTAAMGTRSMSATGRPFLDLTELAANTGLLTDDLPELLPLLGEYERQLAERFRRLHPLAERDFENVMERLCAAGRGEVTGKEGFDAAQSVWNDANPGLLDVERGIDDLTSRTAMQVQTMLLVPLAETWREAWLTRWEPETSELYRLYHLSIIVVKASGIPLDDAQLTTLREHRDRGISAVLKLDNPKYRRHSPYEGDLAALQAFDAGQEAAYLDCRSHVFQWAHQFDPDPAAPEDPANEGMAFRILAALRNDPRSFKSGDPAAAGGTVYQPLTMQDLSRLARQCGVEPAQLAAQLPSLADALAAYQNDLTETWKKAAAAGEPDRFAAVTIFQRCEDRVLDQFAELVLAEKRAAFDALQQERARSLLRRNSRAHFGMSRIDLGAALLTSCTANREVSDQQLDWLARYHTQAWPALQEWLQASAKFCSAAHGAALSADDAQAMFQRLHAAAVAVDALNSRMLADLLPLVPEGERTAFRSRVLETCYPEVLLDKADVRPVIAAAKKLSGNDSDTLQRIMDIAILYEDEYSSVNDKLVAALSGVVDWRTDPANPGPVCRDCEATYQALHKSRAELCGRTLIKLKAVLPPQTWQTLRESGDLPMGAF